MLINRKLWEASFSKDNFPNWICSKCNTGLFKIVKDTFHVACDGTTEMYRFRDNFTSHHYCSRFCAILRCNNKNCQESAVITGRGWLGCVAKYDYEEVEYYKPEYCHPPPAIFKIPEKTPEEITNDILESFSIFLSQPNCAGNKIRTSIEKLMDFQKVRKTTTSRKTRKRVKLTLHNRIVAYGKKNDKLSENILAIKWIGNSASHTQGLKVKDIFDAYDLLHYVLNEIYGNGAKHIAKITKTRNKQKK